ncbi:MAG: protease modulator HflC [Rhodanobacteraceae bacterium]|jgi:membrane protease subunit HflC|nr:protease modulator HflC [Rhodanobacteraceae bacterium]
MRTVSLVVVLVALLIAGNSVFVVNEGQTAILLQFGRIVRTGFEPGLHFKIPLMQQVQRFDKRVLTLDSAPERYLTSEKKDVNIDFFVKWKIVDAGKFYVTVAGDENRAQQRIGPIVKEGLRTAVNTRTLQELVAGGRADVTQHLLTEANRATQGLGIEVVDLRIKRIDLPEDGTVIGSVYERMRSERKKVASQLRAEGAEASKTIRADADRQVQVIAAEAYRDAEKTRGEGDAQAAQTYAAAYGRNPEFYGFYRSLEAYREAFATPNGTLVLDPKSEFLRYLQESK